VKFFILAYFLFQGELNVITYNVEGLPNFLALSDTKDRTEKIASFLYMSDPDIIAFQETFVDTYYNILAVENFAKARFNEKLTNKIYGSGLALFSKVSPIHYYKEHFNTCYGSDCFASKGIQLCRIYPALGITIDVYNTHLDAHNSVKDIEARISQLKRLIEIINSKSEGNAIIFLGDLNIRKNNEHFKYFLRETGLKNLCSSCEGNIDYILIRDGNNIELGIENISFRTGFENLSDHLPLQAQIKWRIKWEKEY
jgi:endonuclease/exonuclease/phosphatase family metal-dependent hydrolase